jgi:transposase
MDLWHPFIKKLTERYAMIFTHPKSENDISELQVALTEATNKKWYRRLKIIQLSMMGETVPSLAKMFDVSLATVRRYISAYEKGGLYALKPRASEGRPPKVGHLKKEDWGAILEKTPNQYEKLSTDSRTWTLSLLALYAKEYIGVEVCFQTIGHALRRCKYRTGRSKLRVGSPDPEYTIKRQRIEQLRGLLLGGN